MSATRKRTAGAMPPEAHSEPLSDILGPQFTQVQGILATASRCLVDWNVGPDFEEGMREDIAQSLDGATALLKALQRALDESADGKVPDAPRVATTAGNTVAQAEYQLGDQLLSEARGICLATAASDGTEEIEGNALDGAARIIDQARESMARLRDAAR